MTAAVPVWGLALMVSLAVSRCAEAQSDEWGLNDQYQRELERAPVASFDETFPSVVPVAYDAAGSEAAAAGCCDELSCNGYACGCHSDLWTRSSLTNGLWGAQPALASQGIVYQAQLTQFYQGVTRGGGEQTFEYGGKLDQFLIFNSKELGLWEGGEIVLHAESRFGDDINREASLLAAPNVNMLYPNGQHVTAITGLQITQALSEKWAITFGKINSLDLLYGIYPQTGRGVTGFMNTSLIVPLSLARTVPLSFLGAGIVRLHEGQFQSGVVVYDSNNIPTTSGFGEMFDNGANVTAFWRSFTDLGGRPGSHLFMGTYASGTYTSLDPTGWDLEPGMGIVAPQETGSWSLLYVLDQKLWVDPCQPTRNVGLFSTWGLADKQTSPYHWIGTVALQGQGLIPGRGQDAVGVGYFYNGLSGEFKDLLSVLDVGNVQGVELYYNAALTPWFQLTADLQMVEPALGARDTAVVLGLRAMMSL